MIRRRPLVLLALPALLSVWLLARAFGGGGPGSPALAIPPPAVPRGEKAPDAGPGPTELETQLRSRPTDAVLRTRAGADYGRRGDYTRAKRELRRAVLLDPRLPEARHNLGLAYLNSFQPEQARTQFQRELEL